MATKGNSALSFALTAFEPVAGQPRALPAELPATTSLPELPRATRPGAWDPYDVWLTRVKIPRDRKAGSGPKAR
jgi:hypothetical protein